MQRCQSEWHILGPSEGLCLYKLGDSYVMGTGERYIATMPTVPFALSETRIVAGMMLDGMDRKEIRSTVHEGNLFGVKTDSNEKKTFNYIYNRLEDYPDELKRRILSDDMSDARFANLLSIMHYDALFREFVFEVYTECRDRRYPVTDYRIMTFFEKKAAESATVRDWRHVTVFKLRRLYARILYEAGFLKTSSGDRDVVTPYVSHDLLRLAADLGYYDYIEATVGSQ